MDRVSCSEQPTYRRIELMDTSKTSKSDVTTSRASSTDSARRSLTPTRIIQPIPKPWTATVSSSRSNLYEQSYAKQQEPSAQVCKEFVQREVCHREHVSDGKDHREEQRSYKAEICQRETICPKLLLPKQEPTETVKEVDIEVTDLRDNKIREMEVLQEIRGKCDFITDTAEETVDEMHVKQSAIFEKTMEETASQERSRTPMIEEEEDETESESLTKRTETHINREVQDTKKEGKIEEQSVEKSSETVMTAIDVQQMLEKAKQEEEEREREEEEKQKKKEKEEKKKCEEEEQKHQKEKERRREEEEKGKKNVTFEDNEEVEEVREQPLGRTVMREERITESDGSVPGRTKITKETYEEITEEVLVQERVRRKNATDDERNKNLREQVKVHQSLRDQQAIDKHGVIIRYSQQPQETMETCKKRVQFLKETETGPKPLSDTSVKNSTPKEWKSEMVNALTTVPDQSYATLNATSSVKELYTEETIYLDHKCRPKPPLAKEKIRPISPFQQALTIAPERSYTLLNREIGPEDQQIASRSQTPSLQVQNERYCPPLDILYGKGSTTRESYSQEQLYVKKEIKESGPRPLPTPSPYDCHLRNFSASPARSRLETSRSLPTSLKKPDTIPSYQKNLVTMKKEPVESRSFIPDRTPTPTTGSSKSPAQELLELSACYVKIPAPKVRDNLRDLRSSKRDSVHFPSSKIISYHVEEDTDTGHRMQEYSASRTVNYDEKETNSLDKGPSDSLYAQFQETRCMTSEESSEQQNTTSHVKKALQVVENYEKCERKEKMPSTPQSLKPITCDINNVTRSKSALIYPMNSQVSPASSRQSIYSSSMDVRRYETPSPKICPETGVTILPCKAHSNRGVKTGVVVVPCEGSQTTCSRSGVCVTPTQDRSSVCVSPYFGISSDTSGQPSDTCGRELNCDFNISNCPNSDICLAPCSNGSVCVTSCKKPGPNQSKINIPFPQIPLPYEETLSLAPLCSTPSFKLRTNLTGQQNVPVVQLYKPIQSQLQVEPSQTQNYAESTYYHAQSYRETDCKSGNRCQKQYRCQNQIHCDPSSKIPQSLVDPSNLSSHPDLDTGVGGLGGASPKSGSFAGSSAPKRGRGILNQAVRAGSRIPLCAHCNSYVRYSRVRLSRLLIADACIFCVSLLFDRRVRFCFCIISLFFFFLSYLFLH